MFDLGSLLNYFRASFPITSVNGLNQGLEVGQVVRFAYMGDFILDSGRKSVPTVDTIMAQIQAKIFILHVFSKHGIPSHITSNRGSEFISLFFRSLGKALDMKLHFTSSYYKCNRQNKLTRLLNSISKFIIITNKVTAATSNNPQAQEPTAHNKLQANQVVVIVQISNYAKLQYH